MYYNSSVKAVTKLLNSINSHCNKQELGEYSGEESLFLQFSYEFSLYSLQIILVSSRWTQDGGEI